MNLYLISQSENDNSDTYDSAVVSAESEKQARNIHPSGEVGHWANLATWATPDEVKVKLIGVSNSNECEVICASWNAG